MLFRSKTEVHRLLRTSVLAAALKVALSLLLVKPLGLAGVALGTLVSTALVCLGLVMPYAMRNTGVSFRRVVAGVILPTALPGCLMAGILWLLREFMQPSSILSVVICVIPAALAYAAAYLANSAACAERNLLLNLIGVGKRFAAQRFTAFTETSSGK